MNNVMSKSKVYARIASPIGPLLLVAERDALCRLDLIARPDFDVDFDDHCDTDVAGQLGDERPGDPVLRAAARQLDQYFAGTRNEFDLPLRLGGTPFQNRVWQLLREIPYGETRSYGDLARAVAQPGASRAVGNANGRNPVAIIVPCHRVIASDGGIGGYAGGLPAKRWLLARESATGLQTGGDGDQATFRFAGSRQPRRATTSGARVADSNVGGARVVRARARAGTGPGGASDRAITTRAPAR